MSTSAAYPIALTLHLASVAASVGLFTARGIGVQLQQPWPMQPLWRRTSVAIDMVLLAAGISLWVLMSHNPLHEPWLATKLVLLLVYIVTGSFALKRAPSLSAKRGFLVTALCTVLFMFLIARTRDPLGAITSLL